MAHAARSAIEMDKYNTIINADCELHQVRIDLWREEVL